MTRPYFHEAQFFTRLNELRDMYAEITAQVAAANKDIKLREPIDAANKALQLKSLKQAGDALGSLRNL